jgi:hypothetical protein
MWEYQFSVVSMPDVLHIELLLLLLLLGLLLLLLYKIFASRCVFYVHFFVL